MITEIKTILTTRTAVLSILLIVTVLIIFIAYKCRQDISQTATVTDLTKKVQEEVDKQFKDRMEAYNNDLKTLKLQQTESRKRADKLTGDIAKLKKDKADAKADEPQNRIELYNLLDELGYKPLR